MLYKTIICAMAILARIAGWLRVREDALRPYAQARIWADIQNQIDAKEIRAAKRWAA